MRQGFTLIFALLLLSQTMAMNEFNNTEPFVSGPAQPRFFLVASFYAGNTCPGDPFNQAAINLDRCVSGGGGFQSVSFACDVTNNVIVQRVYNQPLCNGNSSDFVYSIGQCSELQQNSALSPIAAIANPTFWIPSSCSTPTAELDPFDKTPEAFPDIEEDLPAITTRVWDNTECSEDPAVVIWHRNGACGIGLNSTVGITFSQYECESDGDIVGFEVFPFGVNACNINGTSGQFQPQCSELGGVFSQRVQCLGGTAPPEDDESRFIIATTIPLILTCVACSVTAAVCFVFILRSRTGKRSRKDIQQELEALLTVSFLDQITVGDQIGSGHFGKVYSGVWKETPVALKSVKSSQLEDFLNELKIISDLRHPNVLTFYGLYVFTEDTTFMVVEYMNQGDLLHFLQTEAAVTLVQLTDFSLQAARGVEDLHSHKIVHRDIACRNFLVHKVSDHEYHLKVSDFGLSRVVEDYYNSESKILPIRWLAPEVIQFNKASVASDIWSLGIAIWEIFSRGAIPYAGFTNERVLSDVPKGLRMSPPAECPQEIGRVMLACWKPALERPSAEDVVKTFSQAKKITLDSQTEEEMTSNIYWAFTGDSKPKAWHSQSQDSLSEPSIYTKPSQTESQPNRLVEMEVVYQNEPHLGDYTSQKDLKHLIQADNQVKQLKEEIKSLKSQNEEKDKRIRELEALLLK